MGNTYFPPKKGTDPTPQVGHAPASVRRGGPDAAAPGADEVINNNGAAIGAFLSAMRQNVANSTVGYHKTTFSSPDLDIHYTNDHGNEIIRYDPRPAKPEPEVEPVFPDVPNETVKIANEPIPYTPPALFLMVLFKTKPKAAQGAEWGDGIAAFDMSVLTPKGCGAPVYIGKSAKSEWVKDVGQILRVAQYKLQGTGWILAQQDLTGTLPATGLWLSTTKIGDAVATPADILAVPAINGGVAGTVFTVGGKFSLALNGKITQQQSWATDGGFTVSPYAIASDGTSYFFPMVQGSYITVRLDYSSTLAYSFSQALTGAVTDKENDLYSKLPTPGIHWVAMSSSSEFYASGHAHNEYNYKITIFTQGQQYETGWVDGESYYGKSDFGAVPALQSYKIKQSQKDVSVYDPTVNHTVVKQTPGENDKAFDNTFYLTTYRLGDILDITAFDVQADGSTTKTLTAKTDKSAFVNMLPSSIHIAAATRYPDINTQENYSAGGDEVFGVAPYGPDPPYSTDPAVVSGFYTRLAMIGSGAPDIKSVHEYVATTLVHDALGTGLAGTYHDTGDFDTPDQAPFPAGTSFTASYAGPDGTLMSEAAVDLHWPYSTGTTNTGTTATSTVKVFNETLTYNFAANSDGVPLTTRAPPSLAIHAFPPALGHGGTFDPYYTVIYPDPTGGTNDDVECVTPYARHKGSGQFSFTPWMHLSNGKHYIQAYYVDDTPHAFVDGSTKAGFLDGIAKACKCDPEQIVAMYMDITLATVKAVTGIKPPDYSTSVQGFEPDPPGGYI